MLKYLKAVPDYNSNQIICKKVYRKMTRISDKGAPYIGIAYIFPQEICGRGLCKNLDVFNVEFLDDYEYNRRSTGVELV